MNFFKKLSPFVLGFLLLAGAAFAQGQQTPATDVTDQELENLLALTKDAQVIQQELSQKQQAILEEEGMEVQRFQTIMLSMQNPQAADSIEVTKEEEETVAEIQPKITKAQQDAQQKFVVVIEENELTQQRYQQIVQTLQTDPELAQKFQKMQAEQVDSEEDNSDDTDG